MNRLFSRADIALCSPAGLLKWKVFPACRANHTKNYSLAIKRQLPEISHQLCHLRLLPPLTIRRES